MESHRLERNSSVEPGAMLAFGLDRQQGTTLVAGILRSTLYVNMVTTVTLTYSRDRSS